MLVSIICPMYNEVSVIPAFFKEITDVISTLDEDFEIICINDGSTDDTFDLLINMKKKVSYLRILNLSRNFGKEAALTAGLDFAKGDVVIPIDADLQDPPELITALLEKHKCGYDVVLAKRANRKSDSFLKRVTANIFYYVHNLISHTNIPGNVGDCRLMTRRVVDSLKLLPEKQRFMKGLFAWVGYNTATVEYTRAERAKGDTKFSAFKLWNLAIEGVTSFSSMPLKVWTYIGVLVSIVSFIYSIFIIVKTLVFGIDVPGYASLLTVVLFLGGIQLIGIGVIGEYIARIYMETKQRPIYIIEDEY